MKSMKSMKSMSVNRMIGSFKKRAASNSNGPSPEHAAAAAQHGETPEKTANNSVKAFCESGGNNTGDDVLFLPPIVEAAESSPAAAAECARIIRKYMSKDYSSRPSWQYNAIMLVRILTDNPGETFTRNLDQKVVDTAQTLLKSSKDPRVRQILMETLDEFERMRGYDENLRPLVTMWQKEKEKALKSHGGRLPPPMPYANFAQPPPIHPQTYPQAHQQSQNYFSRNHTNTRLPDPVELTSRLEEARTSAKLLEQVVMNTPPADFPNNDLIKEFADRCQSASRSIQGYMTSENPAPDNDTMENLIDTNEQLQTALNQHRRALLSARKQMGYGERTDSEGPGMDRVDSGHMGARAPSPVSAVDSPGPAGISRKPMGNGKGKAAAVPFAPSDESLPLRGPPAIAGASGSGSGSGSGYGAHGPAGAAGSSRAAGGDDGMDDPFADPFRDPSARPSRDAGPGSSNYDNERHIYEPFNPGFSPAGEHPNKFEDDRETTRLAVPRSQANATGASGSAANSYRDVSDDEDIYAASPKVTEPSQRA